MDNQTVRQTTTEESYCWGNVVARRLKCLDYLISATHGNNRVCCTERLAEICELESLLADLWKRLEMDTRKGDPSAPLRHTRSVAEHWFSKTFAPLITAAEICSIPDSCSITTTSQTL